LAPVEIAVTALMAAYFVGLVWALLRSRRDPVPWWRPVLVFSFGMDVGYLVYGEGWDMGWLNDIFDAMRNRRTPFINPHGGCAYLTGIPLAVWLVSLVVRGRVHVYAMKTVHAGLLLAAGAIGGKARYRGERDAVWRGILVFSCNPLAVVPCLWHGQFDAFVFFFMMISLCLPVLSAAATDFKQGFYYGLAGTFKHWCVMFSPLVMPAAWKRSFDYCLGMAAALALMLLLFLVVNGHFEGFSPIGFKGIVSEFGLFAIFHWVEPPGWGLVVAGLSLGLGLALRWRGGPKELAQAMGILCFLFLGSRTLAHYWGWFLVPGFLCVGRRAFYWTISFLFTLPLLVYNWGENFRIYPQYHELTVFAQGLRGFVYPASFLTALAIWLAWVAMELSRTKPEPDR
jgi:hypothetical protein